MKPLFEAFREAMLHNPNGSRKEAQDYFLQMMRDDPKYLDMLATDYFERMSATHVVSGNNSNYVFKRTGVSLEKGARIAAALVGQPKLAPRREMPAEERRQQQAEAAKQTEQVFESLKAKVRSIILLDMVLPNGKKLREATGAECKKAGGFYAEVARHIKPSQVVDRHLTEGDLQNIRMRLFQSNAA